MQDVSWCFCLLRNCMIRIFSTFNQSFPRLKATSAFHRAFGWNCVLRISFFNRNYKKWLYLKNFQTSNLFSSESTLLLSAAWVVLQSKQSMFQRIFLKESQFIVISNEKGKFSKHHFTQKVRETDHSPSA